MRTIRESARNGRWPPSLLTLRILKCLRCHEDSAYYPYSLSPRYPLIVLGFEEQIKFFLGVVGFVGGSVAGALSHYSSNHIMTTLMAAGLLGFLLMVAVKAKR